MGFFRGEKYAPLRPDMIGDQLPYFEFCQDESSPFWRSHLLQDGSLAMCWKTKVPPSYSYDEGHVIANNELQTFLENMPMVFEAQISITSHNNLSEKIQEYLSLKTSVDKGDILRRSRAEKLLEAGFQGYKVSENGYSMLRDTYMIVTLKSAPQEAVLGLLTFVVDALYRGLSVLLSVVNLDIEKYVGDTFNQIVKESMSEFKEAVLSVESTMDKMYGIKKDKRMSLTDLKRHFWTAYAPSYKDPQQNPTVDKLLPFSHQVFPLPIEHDFDIVKIGQDYHGLVMMAMMPDSVRADYLGVIRRTLLTQYTFFTNIAGANQVMEKMALSLSTALRQRIASVFGKEEAAMFAEEASEVKTRMFGGRKILYTMVGVIVHGYGRREVEEKMLQLNSAFKKLSVVPAVEKGMALQGFSYSWPLVWSNDYTKPFARTRRVMSDDLVDLLPNHGHWSGTKEPQSVYVNRDGELTFFDHTSNDFVNWHYAITGTSGSGKSFAVVDLVLQLFAAGLERQFLITIKDDYDRFAQTMGRLIIIDLDVQSSCINPFAGKITKARLQQWVTSVELMLAKGETVNLGQGEGRLIEQVLAHAYEMVPEGDVLRPTWIKEAYYKFPYSNNEQRAMGMAAADEIGSYCSDGVYGKLFDGPPSVTDKDRLVVFNLQNVLSEKISDLIINAIFTMLDNIMYTGERSAKKHLLVDEMISMISSKGGSQVANQLKRAFRTYRSLNCMCGIASQNEEDLTTDVGQAIIGNITKRLILKPRREMIPQLMKSLGLRSDRHSDNIASLDTKPGYYSEFYLMSPAGEVICRLITDKLTYALATTTPDDVSEIQKLKDENSGDWWKATLQFSEMYPQGVRASKAQSRIEEEKSNRSV